MKDSFESFVNKINYLHSENGCLWDKQQTIESMKKHIIEETEEVVQAIDKKDYDNLKEELGDLLLDILHVCVIAEKNKLFDVKSVLNEIEKKIVRRHPHVFGDKKFSSVEEIERHWKIIKEEERKLKQQEQEEKLKNKS